MARSKLAALFLCLGIARGWVLEAPRNGSVSARPSWRFLARDVPVGASLCVSWLSAGGEVSLGCVLSVDGFVTLFCAPPETRTDAELCPPPGPCAFHFGLALARCDATHAECAPWQDEREPMVQLALQLAPRSSFEYHAPEAGEYRAIARAFAATATSAALACACDDGGGGGGGDGGDGVSRFVAGENAAREPIVMSARPCERLAPGALAPGGAARWTENELQERWLLARLFADVFGGTFVEAGAADIHSAVTDVLERYRCWVGLGVEPIENWAASNARHRPHMLTLRGALCGGAPGPRAGFVADARDPHLSGFAAPGAAADARVVECHAPGEALRGVGLAHVDLFVLDCEGCERDVIASLVREGAADARRRVEVDVFVVEGNDARGAAALLAPTHFLAACIGPMDLVLVRRGSAPATRWRLLGAGTGAPAPDAALDERCPQFAAELAPLGRALDDHD